MNRKLFIRLTVPSLVVGVSFFVACLVSIRYIHRLQTNLARLLAENVTSMQRRARVGSPRAPVAFSQPPLFARSQRKPIETYP